MVKSKTVAALLGPAPVPFPDVTAPSAIAAPRLHDAFGGTIR